MKTRETKTQQTNTQTNKHAHTVKKIDTTQITNTVTNTPPAVSPTTHKGIAGPPITPTNDRQTSTHNQFEAANTPSETTTHSQANSNTNHYN